MLTRIFQTFTAQRVAVSEAIRQARNMHQSTHTQNFDRDPRAVGSCKAPIAGAYACSRSYACTPTPHSGTLGLQPVRTLEGDGTGFDSRKLQVGSTV